MSPFDQQLDLDGGRHDIAPAHETVKLFDSAPQIRGQVALDTDWCEQAACPTSECVECRSIRFRFVPDRGEIVEFDAESVRAAQEIAAKRFHRIPGALFFEVLS